VSGNQDKENRNVIVWNRHNGLNQQWDIVYADSQTTKGGAPSTTGICLSNGGLFNIVSNLGSKRLLTLNNAGNFEIRTKNHSP